MRTVWSLLRNLVGRRQETPLRDSPDEEQDDLTRSMPRRHHYVFAHLALPNFFFGTSPQLLIAALLEPGGNEKLVEMWRVVGRGAEEQLPPNGLSVSPVDFDGRLGALVRFPDALNRPEGQFAALLGATKDDPARYLLLERTVPFGQTGESASSAKGKAWGIVCEWFKDGSRRNHQRTVPLEQTAFELAVIDLLAEERRK
jgi:hypothetical protein